MQYFNRAGAERRWRWMANGLVAAAMALLVTPAGTAQQQVPPALYTVNGIPATLEVQQQMAAYGLLPGHYYIDQFGNFGVVGQPPMTNLDGGPPRNSGPLLDLNSAAPQAVPPTPAPAPFQAGDATLEQQLVGVRLYFAFNSKLGHGGASGYFHFCPNNVFHRNSEGSFRVGGDYNSQTESYDPYAAGASYSAGDGNWRVEPGEDGPVARLVYKDGTDLTFRVSDIQNGRWMRGDFKYFSEVGKASCN